MRRRNGPGNEFTEPEPALFSAVVTPHRSLGSAGFLIVMVAVAGISFVAGLGVLLGGARPVLGGVRLDVLRSYCACRANYRAAAACEEVSVTASELRVRKVSHRGRTSEWSFNPLWVRLDSESHEEFGIERLFL